MIRGIGRGGGGIGGPPEVTRGRRDADVGGLGLVLTLQGEKGGGEIEGGGIE